MITFLWPFVTGRQECCIKVELRWRQHDKASLLVSATAAAAYSQTRLHVCLSDCRSPCLMTLSPFRFLLILLKRLPWIYIVFHCFSFFVIYYFILLLYFLKLLLVFITYVCYVFLIDIGKVGYSCVLTDLRKFRRKSAYFICCSGNRPCNFFDTFNYHHPTLCSLANSVYLNNSVYSRKHEYSRLLHTGWAQKPPCALQ